MQFNFSPLAVTVCARQTHLNIGLIPKLKKFHKNLTNSDALFKATTKNHFPAYEARAYQQVTRGATASHREKSTGRALSGRAGDITSDNLL